MNSQPAALSPRATAAMHPDAEAGGLPPRRVALLYFDGCPNWRMTDDRLREALARTGREDVIVEHGKIATPEQAEAIRFRGSPTVLVDGRDRSSSGTPQWASPAGSTAPRRAWPVRRPSTNWWRSFDEAAGPSPACGDRRAGDLRLLRAGVAARGRP